MEFIFTATDAGAAPPPVSTRLPGAKGEPEVAFDQALEDAQTESAPVAPVEQQERVDQEHDERGQSELLVQIAPAELAVAQEEFLPILAPTLDGTATQPELATDLASETLGSASETPVVTLDQIFGNQAPQGFEQDLGSKKELAKPLQEISSNQSFEPNFEAQQAPSDAQLGEPEGVEMPPTSETALKGSDASQAEDVLPSTKDDSKTIAPPISDEQPTAESEDLATSDADSQSGELKGETSSKRSSSEQTRETPALSEEASENLARSDRGVIESTVEESSKPATKPDIENTLGEETSEEPLTQDFSQDANLGSEQHASRENLGAQAQDLRIRPTAVGASAESQFNLDTKEAAAREPITPEEVVSQVKLNIKTGSSRISFVVDPPELGRLSIQLVMKGGRLTGEIQAETTEVEKALTRGLDGLKETMRAAGIHVDGIEVRATPSVENMNDSWEATTDERRDQAFSKRRQRRHGQGEEPNDHRSADQRTQTDEAGDNSINYFA